MMKKEEIPAALPALSWPINIAQYDRAAALSSAEAAALNEYARNYDAATHEKPAGFYTTMQRLICPLEDVLGHTVLRASHCEFVVLFFLREMVRRATSFWGWSEEEWVETINARRQQQQHVIAIAYLLCSFTRLEAVGGVHLV